MRRYDGSVNFSREWDDYKHGFGSLKEEFWAGNFGQENWTILRKLGII
jgi:hypothetical protein